MLKKFRGTRRAGGVLFNLISNNLLEIGRDVPGTKLLQ